jgi:Tol biopolymer transport system component
MKRQLVAACGALVLVTVLMPSARASRDSKWSEWSTPVPVLNINSAFEDANPAISKDGLSLYFQSTRPGGYGGLDIYVTRRTTTDLPWDVPVNLGGMINTASPELTPALSRDGHYLLFVSPRATGLADIYVSYRADVHDDFAWEAATMLGPEINTSFIDTQPSFFENDDDGLPQLYFNSNRPGGMGLNDVYMTEMNPDGGLWPAVLVPELSSPQNDVGPEIFRNGLEMFFQSDRPGTLGGFDLWTSVRDSVRDPWSPPLNLGVIVNSVSNDGGPAVSSDGEVLFFNSSRPEGLGAADIYMTTRRKR